VVTSEGEMGGSRFSGGLPWNRFENTKGGGGGRKQGVKFSIPDLEGDQGGGKKA